MKTGMSGWVDLLFPLSKPAINRWLFLMQGSLRRLAQIAKLGHRFDHTFAGISGIYGIYCISGTHLFFTINIFP